MKRSQLSNDRHIGMQAGYSNGWEQQREEYSRSEVRSYVQRMSDEEEPGTIKGEKSGDITRATRRKRKPASRLREGDTIIADGVYYPFNDYMQGINDNVLVVGGSGVGKTRSIVRPNILQATGSYVISDPKGNLYDAYQGYLRERGYRVERLDFLDPERSTVHYNFFRYIRCEKDVLKVASMLCDKARDTGGEQFWDQAAQILIQSVLSYLVENEYTGMGEGASLGKVIDILRSGSRGGGRDNTDHNSDMDRMFEEYAKTEPNRLSVRLYESLAMSPTITWNCEIAEALAKYSAYDTKEVRELLEDDTVALDEIGYCKTALFVVVSDTDRSMDKIANVFFSQAMQELCREADSMDNSRLTVPVRFILDDFATNVHIDEFPRMISSIRSRAISTMLMVQAESQLWSGYGNDAETIISNCDTYVYLGGNDINTAEKVGRRCDRPMLDILNMPVGSCWVFRRGQKAISAEIFQLDPFEEKCMREIYGVEMRTSSHTRVRRINRK